MKNLSDELGYRPTEAEVREAISACKRHGHKSVQLMVPDPANSGFTLADKRWVQWSYFERL